MQKIRSFLKELPTGALWIFLFLFWLSIEHKYDRPIRPIFYHLTTIPKDTVKALFLYLSDVAVLVVTAVFLFKKKDQVIAFFSRRHAKFVLVFSLFALFSLFVAKTPVGIIEWSKLLYFLIAFLLYCLILSLFKGKATRPFFLLLFSGILVLSVFECWVGLTQYFTQKPAGVRLLGEPKFSRKDPATSVIITQEGSKWIFDTSSEETQEYKAIFRSYGTLPHPNVLGGFLVFAIFCTYALFSSLRFKGSAFLFPAVLFLQIFTLLTTYSRSAIFGWLIGSILWFFSLMQRKKKVLPRVKLLICLTAVFLGMCVVLFYPQIKVRGGLLNYSALAKASDGERILAQNHAWEMIKKFPLTGVGFANYERAVRAHFPPPFAMIHSIYFLVATELGLIALAVFLFFLAKTLYSGWQKRGDPFFASLFATFAGFVFIGGCDYYLLYFHQGRPLFFAIAAFLALEGEKEESLVLGRLLRPVEL